MPDSKKPNNLKTALIIASIAAAFFIGFFIKRIWFA
ncbi:cytochrome oxidase small assembly protein [Noviherbaspirillum malthae]|nr:cytochrome oxidase small assembly protein [Noviherbaspirillum malthae]